MDFDNLPQLSEKERERVLAEFYQCVKYANPPVYTLPKGLTYWDNINEEEGEQRHARGQSEAETHQ